MAKLLARLSKNAVLHLEIVRLDSPPGFSLLSDQNAWCAAG